MTTPGTTFPETFTLNLYNVGPGPTVGSLITTLTQTVNIPFRPSADPVNCTGGDAGDWFDPVAGVCDPGLATNVVFDLSAGQRRPPDRPHLRHRVRHVNLWPQPDRRAGSG